MASDSRSETFRTSDGCAISYTLHAGYAGAPRLVLIHPLGLDRTVWNGIAERMKGHVELLTYDCRGHGRSEHRVMPFTTDLFARDLVELLDHVDWPIVTVAGCSMGGCVAQAFAGRHPLRLNGLGLIDTTAWYGADAPEKWRERVDAIRAHGLAGMIDFQTQRWFSDAFRERSPDLVNAVSNILLANDIDCYAATCIMLGDADLRHMQRSIRVPVAVVVGEEDYATPVAMSQQLHEALPGSTLKILSGVRHLAPVEAPEQVSVQLLGLLVRATAQDATAIPQ